jgi:isoquinoline 1-oxidoreductase alpha subunit
MTAAALLDRTPSPDRAQITEALAQNICRCGTYQRILGAVERAAAEQGHGRA